MEESLKLLDIIKQQFECEEVDIKTYSPLTLAFIGDCIFDLVVRTKLVAEGNRRAEGLHKDKSTIVKAESQARMAEAFADIFTEEEAEVYRKGRNAKSYSTAKNAKVTDYRKATGLEAVMGYLYLKGEQERIVELTKMGMDIIGSK